MNKSGRHQSQSKHERVKLVISIIIAVFAVISIIISIVSLRSQIDTSSPPTPEINIERIDGDSNLYFAEWRLYQVGYNETWHFFTSPFTIDFIVRNNGRGRAGNIHLEIEDPENLFRGKVTSKEVHPLGFEYFDLSVRNKNCYSGQGRDEYHKMKESGCNEENITMGLREFILVQKCSSCDLKNQKVCYSFNICIYNQSQQERWCEENYGEKDFKLLKLSSCPDLIN